MSSVRSKGIGRGTHARDGVTYPSPFFDIGHTYMPPDFKSLFKWCRYFFLSDPLVHTAVFKSATYPITQVRLDSENIGNHEKWDHMLNGILQVNKQQMGFGLDYFGYGNAFVGISFPFNKHLICKKCGHAHDVRGFNYRFRSYRYEGKCNSCGHRGQMSVYDQYVRDPSRIRLMRYSPEDISIEERPHCEPKLWYKMPGGLRADIRQGKRGAVEELPDIYITAARRGESILLEHVYHMSRPDMSDTGKGDTKGWGFPLIFPVMKDLYFLRILRKAQEMIAQDHIIPMRVIFPSQGNQSDVFGNLVMSTWSRRVRGELERWKKDPNYIPIMPVPIESVNIGGQGKALMLAQDYRFTEESAIMGMLLPIEFVKGGTGYAGTSLSMHMLRNLFDPYRSDYKHFLSNFVVPSIAKYMGWEPIKVDLHPLKQADLLQRTALTLQLNSAGKVSDDTLLSELDYSSSEETMKIERESSRQMRNMTAQGTQQAHIQGQAGQIQMRYQSRAQEEAQGQAQQVEHHMDYVPQMELPPEPQQGQGGALQAVAAQMARNLSRLPDQELYSSLNYMKQYPQLHNAVRQQLLNGQNQQGVNSAALPMPEQKPPTRAAQHAVA